MVRIIGEQERADWAVGETAAEVDMKAGKGFNVKIRKDLPVMVFLKAAVPFIWGYLGEHRRIKEEQKILGK